MKRGIIVLIVIVLLLVIVIASAVGSYNGLVASREEVNTYFGNIDTQLQRRADLIPNLVNTVQGFTKQEQTIINSVTDARAKLAGAQTVGEKAAADGELTSALSRLLVVVENYPEISSNKNFIQLADELAGTENRISVSRTDYNNAVRSYNTKIKSFPTMIFASIFGFEQAEYFETSDTGKEVPKVKF